MGLRNKPQLMPTGGPKKCALLIALSLLCTAPAMPQSAAGKAEKDARTEQPTTRQADQKQVLTDATRVSTSRAAQSAAKQASQKHSREGVSNDPAGGNVLEFRPADRAGAPHDGAPIASSNRSTKSPAKDVHAEVNG